MPEPTPRRMARHRAFTHPSPVLHASAPGSASDADRLGATGTEELHVRRTTAALTRTAVAVLAAVVGVLALGAGPAAAAAAPTPSVRVVGSGSSAAAAGSLAGVKAGQVVDIRLTGFGAATAVLVSIGPAALPRLVTTDAHGSAAAAAIVPKLPTDDYLVTAASRSATASVPLRVTTSSKVRGTTIQWIAPVTGSAASGRSTAAAARHASTSTRAAAPKPSTAPSAIAAPSATAQPVAALPLTSLEALPTSATTSPVGGWLALGALLALAVGGAFTAVGFNLRRDADVEPLGRHAPAHATTRSADEVRAVAVTALGQLRTTGARLASTGHQAASVAVVRVRAGATQLSAAATELRAARAATDEPEPAGRHGRPASD